MKRKIAMALAAVMAMSLMACGGGGTSGSQEDTSAKEEESAPAGEDAGEENAEGADVEAEQGSVAPGETVKLTLFVDEPWWPYSDWSGTMPRWATEQTGVDFDVTVAADTTELDLMVGWHPEHCRMW